MTSSPEEHGPVAADATVMDPAILAHPTAFYRALRKSDPVHYDPKLDMYLVSRYEDVQRVLLDSENFSMELGYNAQFVKGYADEYKAILAREGGGYFPDAIMTDPPTHTRPRRLLEKAFTAHRIKELEPRIRAITVDFIEKIADKGEIDAVKEFAAPLTISVICEQLGLRQFDPEKISRWSTAAGSVLGRMNSRDEMVAMAREVCELQLYMAERVKERQASRTEDLLSDMIYARIDDDERPTLSHEELMALARLLLAGGNDTVSTALSTLLFVLATEPKVAQQLYEVADDERLLNRFVEELLRYEPPVRGLSRMTRREVELGGKTLPKGAHVLMLFASANDDESEFPNARAFDMNRPNVGRHMSFGAGVHRCVGMALARMEVKVAAKEIIQRLGNFKLAVPEDELTFVPTIALRIFTQLPITFTRRTR